MSFLGYILCEKFLLFTFLTSFGSNQIFLDCLEPVNSAVNYHSYIHHNGVVIKNKTKSFE